VHGAQTAKVTGPEGEEIHTDFHARVKVQFHWDRLGSDDERSSCWIRVAQSWAGAGWGFTFVPRIGMEVVVTFLDGDPDKPLVTGCVYNGENTTAYGLPGDKTRSTIKTWSSPSSGGYNELRFEDRAGEEQVYVRAERDHDTYVKHDQTVTVDNDRTKVIKGRETNTIQRDRVTRVEGNEAKEMQGNNDVVVHGGTGYTVTVDQCFYLSADKQVNLVCGGSTVVMTPESIRITSERVSIEGHDKIELIGGVIELNC
jgi:type VI secretion system secreted protein VgrG